LRIRLEQHKDIPEKGWNTNREFQNKFGILSGLSCVKTEKHQDIQELGRDNIRAFLIRI
jgi:hypothetical protein